MEKTESDNGGRLTIAPEHPKSVYFEAAVLFFGANFLFHQNVFRRVGSRQQFAAFMLVNAFASYQIAECSNITYLRRQAILLNNTREIEHRSKVNELIRSKLINARIF